MKIKGIDISYCQRNVDYKKARENGVEFAIIRSGYRENTDDMLDKHVKGCTEAGIKYGFYVYSVAMSTDEAVAEANHCLKSIKDYRPEYPIFYDLEDVRMEKLGRDKITEIALAFLKIIKDAGYFAAYYANPSWIENYIYKDKLSGYDLWLAAWTENPDKQTKYNYGQKMWQWGLDNISGIGVVDGNLCYRDYPTTIKKGGYNRLDSEPVPETTPEKTDYDLTFSDVHKYYKCVGSSVKLRKYPSDNAPVMGVLEKNAIYKTTGEMFENNKLKWLCINGGYSMYIDQVNSILFTAAEKPSEEFKTGDYVEIIKPYAASSCSYTATNKAAMGGKRYIVRKYDGRAFPYQLGVKKGDYSLSNTTGFANSDGIKKL